MKIMSVVASWSDRASPVPAGVAAILPRAEGDAALSFKRRGEATAIDRLYQSGVLRLRLPRVEPGDPPEAVLLNTAGGITGGDRLTLSLRWGAGTSGAVSGQAAERIYRSLAGVATVRTTIEVESSATAEWLPQETILFDGAALERELSIALAPGARFLGVETLVFGRTARGERLRQGRLRDAWRLWRDGRLVFAEAIDLEGALGVALDRRAAASGFAAVALLVLAAADAESRLGPLRELLAGATGRAAASAWNGLLVARFAAADSQALRSDLLPALALLRDGRLPPRVWRC
jgi:urease accessory protein